MAASQASFSLESHSRCAEAAGGPGEAGARDRDSPPTTQQAGVSLPHPATRGLTVLMCVITLLKVMSKVCMCVCWCGRTCGALAWVVVAMVGVLAAPAEAFCPSGCACDYASLEVQCGGAALDGVPILLNPRVQRLLLHHNHIQSLAQSLVFYHDLRLLDLSWNSLVSLGRDNFKEQRRLEELRLGHNTLQTVGGAALRGLTSLHKLSLSHNAIAQLEDGAFEDTGNLAELDLSHNLLRAVGDGAVRGLVSLEQLDLSGNRLTRAPGGGFTSLPALRLLNLTHNLISQVPPRAFSGFPVLASLVLDRNNISTIASAAFHEMTELRRLSLAANRLLVVPSSSLASLPRLLHLDLSGNLFESLPEDCFRGLEGLQSLVVSRCPRLHSLSGEAFLSVASLASLQLNHNPRLVSLPSAAFASLLALRHLDLSACGLLTLTPTQVPLQNLRSLSIAANPLTCNCSLLWLSRLAADANTSITLDEPTCATPPGLYGMSLWDLAEDEAGCQSALMVWVAAAGVVIGVVLLLALSLALSLYWRRHRRRKKRRREEDKGCWEDPFLPDGGLSATRLHHSRPYNTPPIHPTLTNPTRLGPPPRLSPMHPLHNHLHQEYLQQYPYGPLHPLYRPLLHGDYERGRLSPPTTPSSMTSPPPLPLSDPPNWYATIGGDGGEDSGRESRPPTPLDLTQSPRKVPVTYV